MPEEIKEEQLKVEADHGKKLAEWEFSEYVKYQRTLAWYIGLGIIGAAVIIYSIFSKNFLFALIVILIGFILVLHSKREPAGLKCLIFEDGIQVGTRFYDWDEIKSFRLVYKPPKVKLLYIDLKSILMPDFSVPLNNQNPLEIRQILKIYLPEDLEKQYETLTDRMNRWLKL
ncbi:MAG: hypothetical protein ACP5IX_02310 [Patescibacteria group bacterium]